MDKKEIAEEKVTKTTGAKAQVKKAPAESVYGVRELAAYSEKVFGAGVHSECVVAAFKAAGRTEATKAEAKEIVGEFSKKEVK